MKAKQKFCERTWIDKSAGTYIETYSNGDKCWYLNGRLHRTDGPAIEYANGAKYWYLNGKFHRTDGPACEYTDGETRYWINDKHIPQLDNKRIYGEDLEKLLVLI